MSIWHGEHWQGWCPIHGDQFMDNGVCMKCEEIEQNTEDEVYQCECGHDDYYSAFPRNRYNDNIYCPVCGSYNIELLEPEVKKKVTCPTCGGSGELQSVWQDTSYECYDCHGEGYIEE